MPDPHNLPPKRPELPPLDVEPGYVDYGDPKVVAKLLKEAFARWVPPDGGRKGGGRMDGKPTKPRGIWWKKNYGTVSKFCYERAEKFLMYLGMGMWFEQVCSLVGVKSKTVHEWITKGAEPEQGPYYVFARAVDQIAAGFEAKQLANIHTLTFGRDQAGRRYMAAKDAADMSLRMLKAKFPKRWGDRMDVTSDGKALGDRPAKVEIAFVDAATATPLVDDKEDDSQDEG